MTQLTAIRETLHHLILTRLLASGKSPAPGQISKDLKPCFEHRIESESAWTTQCQTALEALQQEGLITTKPRGLTAEGRRIALEFLGVNELPGSVQWGTLKKKYLMTRALGLDTREKTTLDKIGDSDKLRAAVLVKEYELPTAPVPTSTQALNALAWKLIGIESTQTFNVKNVIALLLSRQLETPRPLNPNSLKDQLPALLTNARSSDINQLRAALLQSLTHATDFENGEPASEEILPFPTFTAAPSPIEEEQPSFDLGDFAQIVQSLARNCPTGKFGDNKVFISHVWREFRNQSLSPSMTETEFKSHLVEAYRQDLLQLSRADLIQVMNPDDVRESEITGSTYTFHFIRI